MAKPPLSVPELVTLFLGGALAADMGWQLAHHHVSVAFTVAAVLSLLANAAMIGARLTRARQVRILTCPADSCTVRIEATGTSDQELTRLRALVGDHTRHDA
jgi:hypothetical protein